jgi:hypothetical protein
MKHVFRAAAGLVGIDRERICGNQQVRARVSVPLVGRLITTR